MRLPLSRGQVAAGGYSPSHSLAAARSSICPRTPKCSHYRRAFRVGTGSSTVSRSQGRQEASGESISLVRAKWLFKFGFAAMMPSINSQSRSRLASGCVIAPRSSAGNTVEATDGDVLTQVGIKRICVPRIKVCRRNSRTGCRNGIGSVTCQFGGGYKQPTCSAMLCGDDG